MAITSWKLPAALAVAAILCGTLPAQAQAPKARTSATSPVKLVGRDN